MACTTWTKSTRPTTTWTKAIDCTDDDTVVVTPPDDGGGTTTGTQGQAIGLLLCLTKAA